MDSNRSGITPTYRSNRLGLQAEQPEETLRILCQTRAET